MSSRPIKLVVAVCYTNSSYIPNSVKSIIDGFIRCTDIVVADYGPPLATSLRKKENVSIIRTPKYGALSSLYAAVEKHGTGPDVHYILIDGNTIYMPHLIPEYLNTAPQMDKIIAEKINDSTKLKGVVYGLAGVIFGENKKQALDDELSSLLGETDEPSSGFSCTTPNISQENSTVDLLDFMGSVYIRGPFLDGLKEEMFATVKSYQTAEAAVLLANWLASKDVLRVQVCTLTNNRFIMERIKSFERVSYSPTAYESTLKDLHIKKCLHLCKLSGPKGT
jgi:hypothetical protein